jgi:hypothetical protein
VSRYTRQTRLAEVGEAGQARLLASRVELEAGTEVGRMVEHRYLEGAGIQVTGARSAGGAMPGWIAAMDPAARDVAEGAYRALAAVKSVLEIGADGAVG